MTDVKGKTVTTDVKRKTKATGAKGRPKGTDLKEFLSNLAIDPRRLGEFLHVPEPVMSAANLSEADKTALRSGVSGMVAARLAGAGEFPRAEHVIGVPQPPKPQGPPHPEPPPPQPPPPQPPETPPRLQIGVTPKPPQTG
jgi:hypothetical protein